MVDVKTTEEVTNVMKALADPNRFRVFAQLMKGDSCNCELKEKLGLPPSLLSHHLRALREIGLVDCRRDSIDGRWVYYSVNREKIAEWHAWFEAFLDPDRIRARATLCGPEGQLTVDPSLVKAGLG